MSTREIAIAIWTVLALFAVLRNDSVRASLYEVIKSFFTSKLVVIWVTLALYVFGVVWALRNVGYWRTDLLKETLVWFVFTAFAYPFQFYKDKEHRTIAGTIFRDAVSILIIIELLVDTYTFHLAVELILVPVMTLVVLLGTVAEWKPEHRPVARLMSGLQVFVGLTLAFLAIRSAIADPNFDFLSVTRELMLPVLLSIATIPYIYFFKLWVAYDDLTWRVGRLGELSPWFRHWAAALIMLHARFQPSNVRAFLKRHGLRLHRIKTREDLRQLLTNDREGSPLPENLDEDW